MLPSQELEQEKDIKKIIDINPEEENKEKSKKL